MDFDDDAVLQRDTFTGQSLDLLLLGSSGGLNIAGASDPLGLLAALPASG